MNHFGAALKRRYGGRVQRVSLDAGMTCPNVDGAVLKGGCNFCDNRSFSPSRRVRLAQIREQLLRGIQSVRHRYKKVTGFIAYFQPATNTYAGIDDLREIYELALSVHPEIVGLAVGTRPDCVPDSVLDLLSELNQQHDVSIEYGMQSVHEASLRWMNRGHTHDDMINAADRTRSRNLEMGAHVIFGVPGETPEMMLQAADAINELGVDNVKIHNLYAVRGTPLGDEVEAGKFEFMSRDAYVNVVVDFIEKLSPDVIVERISGDAPPQFLLGPMWCSEKSKLRLQIEAELRRRKTRQGSRYRPPAVAPSDRPVPPDQTPASIRQRIERKGRLPVLKIEAANHRSARGL